MIEKMQQLDVALSEVQPYLQDQSPCIFLDCSVGFSEPYSIERIQSTNNTMQLAGFTKGDDRIFTTDGTLAQYWRRKDVTVIIYFYPGMPGATCKLNKIGEETKVVPIYEVTCLEA